MTDRYNKFEMPITDWAEHKEKKDSIQGYLHQKAIVRGLKSILNIKMFNEILKMTKPSLKVNKRMRRSAGVYDFIDVEVENALHSVKTKRLIEFKERLDKDSINAQEMLDLLTDIFKASFRKDIEE